MKVLINTNIYWPEGSGGSLATYLVTKILSRNKDFDVTVVTGTRKPVKLTNVKFIIDPILKASSKIELLLKFINPVVRRRYKELIKNFDILYIPSYSFQGYLLIPIAKSLGKRVIVHLHDYHPFSYNSVILSDQHKGFLTDISYEAKYEVYEHSSIKRAISGSMLTPIAYLSRLWLRQTDDIICVSRRQAEIVAEKAPELKNKIRVIYNPLPNVPLIEKKLEEPAFLYLGGDSYVKGFYVLLDASRRILKRCPSVEFLLAGRFRDLSRLLIEKLNRRFNGAYRMLGYLKHKDIMRLHGSSYALLFPSIIEEPLPYAVLESMLAGTIPVASRVGGVPEIVEDTSAEKLSFTPGNADELVDRIESVLSMSKEQLADIGAKLRESVLRRFNNEKIKQALLKVFTM